MSSSSSVFKVLKADRAARVGQLAIGNSVIATPAPLLYTQKGSLLNLTLDLLQSSLPAAAGVQLDAHHFATAPSAGVLQQNGGARGFAGSPDLPVVVTARDSLNFEYTGKSNRNACVAVKTSMGNVEVTPAAYMQTVTALQPDLFTALADEIASGANWKRARASVTRTAQWLDACLQQHAAGGGTAGVLAPIVGGSHVDQRARSAKAAAARAGIAGFALSGFGTGESRAEMTAALAAAAAELPAHLPRLAQGFGSPQEVVTAAAHGVDLFDSGYAQKASAAGVALVFPLRPYSASTVDGSAAAASNSGGAAEAQPHHISSPSAVDGGLGGSHGSGAPCESDPLGSAGDAQSDFRAAAATERHGSGQPMLLDLTDAAYRTDKRPLLAGCSCATCANHSRAYIHHLLQTKELLALVLLDLHNLHHYLAFFEQLRAAISDGSFTEYSRWVVAATQGEQLPRQTVSGAPAAPGVPAEFVA